MRREQATFHRRPAKRPGSSCTARARRSPRTGPPAVIQPNRPAPSQAKRCCQPPSPVWPARSACASNVPPMGRACVSMRGQVVLAGGRQGSGARMIGRFVGYAVPFKAALALERQGRLRIGRQACDSADNGTDRRRSRGEGKDDEPYAVQHFRLLLCARNMYVNAPPANQRHACMHRCYCIRAR